MKLTEFQFMDQVIDLARLRGWRIHHTRPARTKSGWHTPIQGDPGFPDLVLARKPRVIFAELKSEKGKVSSEQQLWLDILHATPAETYTWYPSDWDRIMESLA